MPQKINILSFVPYTVLPANSGGRFGIVDLHDTLGEYLNDCLLVTKNNYSTQKYNFNFIPLFSNSLIRYFPFIYNKKIYKIIKEKKINALFCDHPYMAITVNAIAQKCNIPWFLRSHNIESERFRTLHKKWWKILYYYEQWAFKKASTIFTITKEDTEWAIKNFNINANKLIVAPFGTRIQKFAQKDGFTKINFCKKHYLDPNKPILYFLATLNYFPNYNAVDNILNYIIPLLKQKNKDYQIIIIGKNLVKDIEEKIKNSEYNIKYLDFIEDINALFHTADVMINPMLYGGGVKTKLLEALANNINSVSTLSGSFGVDRNLCNGKLFISEDNDWLGFTENIINAVQLKNNIQDDFYQQYNWSNITKLISTAIIEKIK